MTDEDLAAEVKAIHTIAHRLRTQIRSVNANMPTNARPFVKEPAYRSHELAAELDDRLGALEDRIAKRMELSA